VTALSIIALVLVCAALLVFVVLVSVRFMGSMLKHRSGYARLAALYPAVSRPEGRVLRGQTVQFGAVRYTRCVTVGLDDEGLYLKVVSRSLGRHRPLLVPWQEVRATYPSHLRLRDAVELIVGAPQIASLRVLPPLYAEFRARLTLAAPWE
jgi:hypothetical protein